MSSTAPSEKTGSQERDVWESLNRSQRSRQAESRILAIVAERPGITARDIALALHPGKYRTTLHSVDTRLHKRGQVHREGTGMRNDPYRYYPVL